MEILDSSEPYLNWDRNLSELSESGEIDSVLYNNVSDPVRVGVGKVIDQDLLVIRGVVTKLKLR